MAQLALKQWDDAIETINKGLEIDPKNINLLNSLKKAKAQEETVTEKRTPIYEYFVQLQDKSPLFEAVNSLFFLYKYCITLLKKPENEINSKIYII